MIGRIGVIAALAPLAWAPASGQPQEAVWRWIEDQRAVTAAAAAPHQGRLSLMCWPSASGGRTIPSLRLETSYAAGSPLARTHAFSRVEMQLVTYRDGRRTYAAAGLAEFSVARRPGSPRAELVVESLRHGDVSDPGARAYIQALANATAVSVNLRADGGPWHATRFATAGLSAAITGSWCR